MKLSAIVVAILSGTHQNQADLNGHEKWKVLRGRNLDAFSGHLNRGNKYCNTNDMESNKFARIKDAMITRVHTGMHCTRQLLFTGPFSNIFQTHEANIKYR